MDDPIGNHPTRAEQLDILTTIITDQAIPNNRVLDLGCGTGYVASLLFDKRSDLFYAGLDCKEESLVEARTNLKLYADRTKWIVGNLETVDKLELSETNYQFIISALTFHDLDDNAKRKVISFAKEHLTADGFFFLYDRIRLTEGSLFPLQKSIWSRIDRVYGRGMRNAASFEAYEADIAPNNRPGRLEDYMDWFNKIGMKAQVLHLHGNIALIGASKMF